MVGRPQENESPRRHRPQAAARTDIRRRERQYKTMPFHLLAGLQRRRGGSEVRQWTVRSALLAPGPGLVSRVSRCGGQQKILPSRVGPVVGYHRGKIQVGESVQAQPRDRISGLLSVEILLSLTFFQSE